MRPPEKSNTIVIDGRPTQQRSNTNRPETIWPEEWARMSKSKRKKAIKAAKPWLEERDHLRKMHDVKELTKEDKEEYDIIMTPLKKTFAPETAPSMPTINVA